MSRKSILVTIVSIDLIAIVIALILGKTPGQYFGERYPMTYLSSFQLLVISGLAWKIFVMRLDESRLKFWKGPFFIWLIVAMTFMYLSLDEVGSIHEKIDFFIHRFFKIRETGLTDRIDDVIVGCYGLIGLMVLYLFREELKKYREAFPLLTVGFIFMFSMVTLDILTGRKDILRILISNAYVVNRLHLWLSAIEDMFKIIAEGAFLVGFYYCLEITRRLRSKSI